MRHYGLIGEKLGHSYSKIIHESFFRQMGIAADYQLIEIPQGALSETMPRLRALDGYNVTIPYKKEIIPYLSSVEEDASCAGAVNTVDQAGRGYNTDVTGFAAMIRYHHMDVAGRTVYVLGTGGASVAVVAALRQMQAGAIVPVSRTPACGLLTYEQLVQTIVHQPGILVNTTPVGMFPHTDASPVGREMLRYALGVADIVYNPAETLLTRTAKELGVPAFTGLYMLVAQALHAQQIWQGLEIPPEMTESIMKELSMV